MTDYSLGEHPAEVQYYSHDLASAATTYLVNLNSLDLVAGRNYRRAKDYLRRHGLLTLDHKLLLIDAMAQKINHAQMLQRMIYAIEFTGEHSTGELRRRARLMENSFLEPWMGKAHAQVGAKHNQYLGKHFLSRGLAQAHMDLNLVARRLSCPRLTQLLDSYTVIANRDTRNHMDLCREVITLMEKIDTYDIRSAGPIFRSPLAYVLRSRQAVTLALKERTDATFV